MQCVSKHWACCYQRSRSISSKHKRGLIILAIENNAIKPQRHCKVCSWGMGEEGLKGNSTKYQKGQPQQGLPCPAESSGNSHDYFGKQCNVTKDFESGHSLHPRLSLVSFVCPECHFWSWKLGSHTNSQPWCDGTSKRIRSSRLNKQIK